jgi:hypothetical protein
MSGKQIRERLVLEVGNEDDGAGRREGQRHVAGVRSKEHVGTLGDERAGQLVPERFILELDEADVTRGGPARSRLSGAW